jgi:hypothetical protein
MAKLTALQRARLSSSAFAFPKQRKFPIHDKGHAMHAIRIGSLQVSKGNLSIKDYNKMIKKINVRWGFNAKLKK